MLKKFAKLYKEKFIVGLLTRGAILTAMLIVQALCGWTSTIAGILSLCVVWFTDDILKLIAD